MTVESLEASLDVVNRLLDGTDFGDDDETNNRAQEALDFYAVTYPYAVYQANDPMVNWQVRADGLRQHLGF